MIVFQYVAAVFTYANTAREPTALGKQRVGELARPTEKKIHRIESSSYVLYIYIYIHSFFLLLLLFYQMPCVCVCMFVCAPQSLAPTVWKNDRGPSGLIS